MSRWDKPLDEDRSTEELIIELGEDLDKCLAGIVRSVNRGKRIEGGGVEPSAVFGFHGRQAARALFAYLEGASFAIRVWAVAHLLRMEKISDEERLMAFERRFELNDAGELEEKSAKITLVRNIKFTFKLLNRVHGTESKLETQHWWAALLRSIKVRDRLTHPRMPLDLDVSGDEVTDIFKTANGFRELLVTYSRLASNLPRLE